jgi:hypothetical protein
VFPNGTLTADAIAHTEKRITDQLMLIQRLRLRNEDAFDAVKLLPAMRKTLGQLCGGRERALAKARRQAAALDPTPFFAKR